MNTRHIVALISCILLASSSLVACGDSDDDQDNQGPNATPNQGENAAPGNSNSGPNDNPNNSNNANNSNNTTPNNGGDWQQFPLDGIYQVTSHTEQSDGCDGNGSPVTDDTADYVRVEGHSFQELEYRLQFCDTAAAENCDIMNFTISFEDEQDHVDEGLNPGIINEVYRITTRNNSNTDNYCWLEGWARDVEWTGDGMIIRRETTELEFSTSTESDEPWVCSSGSNQDDATAQAMECVGLEVLELTRVD